MKKIVDKFFLALIFTFTLFFAISSTDNESWLTLWFLMLIFGAIPFDLLVLKDLCTSIAPKWLGPSQILLHVCAIFGGLIGYGLGIMAVESNHEKAHLHQLLVVILPLLVYATPLIMVFHGVPISKIKDFYYKSKDKDS